MDRDPLAPSDRLLEPRRRIDQALYAVVMEAYVAGVSTRAVDDLVAAMGLDTGISKSEVSRICAGLDERVGAFRGRTLGHVGFPYVYLDATYVHVRDDALGQVVSRAVVVATGITAWLMVQALVNIGAVIGRLPITGVPLPFISFGGSSLFVNLAAIGLLLNIARDPAPLPASVRRRS